MTSRSVGVVIPVGSVDEILEKQIRQVLAQDCAALSEVVLSLNTSDERSRSTLTSMVARIADERVRVVESSDHRGAAHARNVGAAAVTADLVAFCDADDWVHNHWLAALVEGLEHFDAVSGKVVDVFPDDRMAAWHPPATPGDLPSFLGRPYVLTGNLAIRRQAFEDVGGFDETLTRCEDIAIGWALQQHGLTIGYVDGAGIDYRHRPGIGAMLRQHYLYGRGMSEVLQRYGAPSGDGWSGAPGLRMMKPNGQRASRRTVVGTMRRGAIAAGRIRGMIKFPRTDLQHVQQ